MTTTKPIPLDEGLLFETLGSGVMVRHAAARNHLQSYLANGGGPNRRIKERALLEISAVNGWVEETEHLLARGADVHMDNDVALRRSACEGHANVVRLLLAHGADVHANDDGTLQAAAEYGRADVVRLLLVNGADIHANNDAALRWAALNGHTDIVRLLLAHGADIHALDDEALRWAALNQHKPTIEVLLMAGANVATAVELATKRSQCAVLATIDACAAAIQDDQRQELLKSFGKQMPALAALVRQEQRRSNRKVP